MSKEITDPYFNYKDKVEYDYEFKVTQPIKLKSDDYSNINRVPEQQLEDACENIMKGIESLIVDEDYNAESFPELGLGRVYPGANCVYEDMIEMYFGISLVDTKDEVTLEKLKEDIEEYMKVLDSNVNYDYSVTGWSNDEEDVEPASFTFKCDGKPKIEVLKQPQKTEVKEFDVEAYVKDIDKQLVSEGKLTFENPVKQSIVEVKLNDDGIIEFYNNNKMESTKPFSKLALIRECKSLVQEGYIMTMKLNEAEIKNGEETLDTEKEKENIEQATRDVEELQKMKDELTDKVNKLMDEEKEIKRESPMKIPEFPSTDFTSKKLTANELAEINLKDNLTQEQKDYIDMYMCKSDGEGFETVDELEWYLKNDYANNFFPDLADEPITSLDDYINGINEVRKEKNND